MLDKTKRRNIYLFYDPKNMQGRYSSLIPTVHLLVI